MTRDNIFIGNFKVYNLNFYGKFPDIKGDFIETGRINMGINREAFEVFGVFNTFVEVRLKSRRDLSVLEGFEELGFFERDVDGLFGVISGIDEFF